MLPHYLGKKLHLLNIHNPEDLSRLDPLKVFQWLKYSQKNITYQVLFDLYSWHNNIVQPLSLAKQNSLIKQFKQAPPSYPPLAQATIEYYLNHALAMAQKALNHNEIPIGAIVVEDKVPNAYHADDFALIGESSNLTLTRQNICAHAEIIALQQAARQQGNHRLSNCDLYVTVEPCLMCMGAILHSRIRRVIFGTHEPKTGAIISQYQVLENKQVNHQTEALGPINSELFCQTLQNFMHKKRGLAQGLL